MDTNFTDNFLVKENQNSISKILTPIIKGKLTKEEGQKMLEAEKKKNSMNFKKKLYADGSQSLLVVIQAMDAAGKDSLIEHVFGGVNPQGCEVTSLKRQLLKNTVMISSGGIIWFTRKRENRNFQPKSLRKCFGV